MSSLHKGSADGVPYFLMFVAFVLLESVFLNCFRHSCVGIYLVKLHILHLIYMWFEVKNDVSCVFVSCCPLVWVCILVC